MGGNASYIVWNITNVHIIDEKISKVFTLFNGLFGVLINNAGVQPLEFFSNVSEAKWDKVYNTNSKGLFFDTICLQYLDKV